MKRVIVGNVEIGEGLPPLLIAEIGLNHNGSMELAKQMIKAAVHSGAHVVKFQKRDPAALATSCFLDAPFLKCPLFGRTQREVRTKLEFNETQLADLKEYAESYGTIFSMSVFDEPSLKIAQSLNLDFIKIASHSVTNLPFLKLVSHVQKPVFLSMGASTWSERDAAVACLRNCPLVVLHCVSAYPCPDSVVNLGTIQKIQTRYNCVVGYSGHEKDILPSVIAVAKGASVIERHFTLNRSMIGLDHKLSLVPTEFSTLADSIARVPGLLGEVADILPEEMAARTNYHVSVCAAVNLKAGTVLSQDKLLCKQPLGDAMVNFSGAEFDSLIGKKLKRDIAGDSAIPRDAVE
ncbi:MAG: N-acetylneuraminate synthase family protein [Deltaproteobacteria bacterium]|nr:N-acetylneuraminate synthase family protein [Deltaproteobacteria bacterium]MBN2674610.1 N-acetylneuraminate synthase family protein [Deltaproteobacteria bacterium]